MKILETKNLKKYFGEVHAVDNVNIYVDYGEKVAVVGSNGAGKTTLINLISRWLDVDSGKIIFQGKDITNYDVRKAVESGIVRSLQLVRLFDNMTVYDNLRVAVAKSLNKGNKMLHLIDMDKQINEISLSILNEFGLLDKKDMLAGEIPHGDRKLLDVAISAALKPKLLMLDEPTSGVSTADKKIFMNRIVEYIEKEGITLVFIEHDMDIVFGYADRVIVMHEGKVIAEGKPEEVKSDTLVRSVLLGVE